MAKDPAFTFYYKDWLVSTAGWDADVRGWFMNLLCHQADKPDGLPDDMETLAELAGVKHSQYKRFCECFKRTLKAKFEANAEGHLENTNLAEKLEERRGYKDMQALRGAAGYYIKMARKEMHLSKAQTQRIFDLLKEADFLSLSKKDRADCFKRTLEASLIGNGNGSGNVIMVENKGGTGGKGDPDQPLPQMKPAQYPVHQLMEIWRKQFPNYPAHQDLDFKALWQISEFLRTQKGLGSDYTQATKATIAEYWQQLVAYIATDSHLLKYNLQQVHKFLQGIIQGFSAPKPSDKIDTELQFMYELYLEKGKVPQKQISETHYARLNERGLVPPVSDALRAHVIEVRIGHLESTRPAHWEKLRDAYLAEQPSEDQQQLLEADKSFILLHGRRKLVLEYFKQQAAAGATNVTTKKNA